MPIFDFVSDNPESPYCKDNSAYNKPYEVVLSHPENESLLAGSYIVECPVTGSPMRKIYTTNVRFDFKGSGFYVNDSILSN